VPFPAPGGPIMMTFSAIAFLSVVSPAVRECASSS
jgi:hypothetical protein